MKNIKKGINLLKIKKITIILYLFLLINISNAQIGTSINSTGKAPDPSAMLDVSSTNSGVAIPRMTTAQRNAINMPVTGLMIFNTDCNNFNYNAGTPSAPNWVALNTNNGSMPSQPGNISGSTSVCENTTGTYSISSIPEATNYYWTVPAGSSITSGQGTTSITIIFGNVPGNISVIESNACGTSNPSSLAINVNSAPSTAGPISGFFTGIVPGQSALVTYSISSIPNAVIYNWALPSGATIQSGTGTTSIIVKYNCEAVSGYISVTSQNSCGTSSSETLGITVSRGVSAKAGGSMTGFGTIGSNPTASGGQSPYNYSWSPTSNLSNSTIANPTAESCGITTYTVTVTDANSCTDTSSVTVISNLTANAGSNLQSTGCGYTIGGNPTASQGNSSSYTYSWSPVSGLSSSSVANPEASPNITTNYTVTVTDASGCTASSSMTFTVGSLTGNSTIFDYTGGEQQWTIPAGVYCIIINAYGAAGGSVNGVTGGNGGEVQTHLSVIPGTKLNIYVGGLGGIGNNVSGSGGNSGYGYSYNGGVGGNGGGEGYGYGGSGGGGSTSVYNLGSPVVVAGGGGGAGGGNGSNGGTGGYGGNNAGNGSNSGNYNNNIGSGGVASNQSIGPGGNGGSSSYGGGGGGGGGYNGGGGGNGGILGSGGGGGGGGSSYSGTGTYNVIYNDGCSTCTGNGKVLIAW